VISIGFTNNASLGEQDIPGVHYFRISDITGNRSD
jgi:hypothetical protein